MRYLKYYLIVLGISTLPLISIFLTSQFPHLHDGLVHLARIGAYFKALQDGQLPVRWAGDLNYGYGMPLFNFIYHVPYLISSFFILLGAGLVNAFKITLVLSFLLSGIFMFGFSMAFFKNIKKAFLVTLFYQFIPFRLVEILIRGSFGEVYAYAFFPLVLWGITLLFGKPSFKNILVVSLGTSLLILSHNSISLVFFLICIFFVLFFAKRPKNYIYSFISLFLGLLLASFYWIPAIFEHRYTYGDLFMKNLYVSHFPPLLNFFIPNFLNDTRLQTGGISVQFGLFHTFVFMLVLVVLFSKNKIAKLEKLIIIFCLSIFLIALFIMQPISIFVWEKIALLRQFQFSWRLLSVVGFATSLMSIFLFYFKFFRKNIIYFPFLFLLVFSTVYYWRPVLGWDKVNEDYYWNFPLSTTYFGETDVVWSEGPKNSYPKRRVDLIGGKGEIGEVIKKSNLRLFKVKAETEIQLVDNTQYFPGWRVLVDGRTVPIEFQDQNWRGLITFRVPKGEHDIKVVFGESPVRFIADTITIGTFGLLMVFGMLRKKRKLV